MRRVVRLVVAALSAAALVVGGLPIGSASARADRSYVSGNFAFGPVPVEATRVSGGARLEWTVEATGTIESASDPSLVGQQVSISEQVVLGYKPSDDILITGGQVRGRAMLGLQVGARDLEVDAVVRGTIGCDASTQTCDLDLQMRGTTPGGAVLYIEQGNILQVGDSIMEGIGRFGLNVNGLNVNGLNVNGISGLLI